MVARRVETRRGIALRLVVALLVLIVVVIGAAYMWVRLRGTESSQSAIVQQPKNCNDISNIPLPVDSSELKGVLYPGQVRNGSYRTYGSMQVRSSVNDAVIRLPAAAKLVSGRSYIDQGEKQYSLNFETDCNIHFWFDHLSVLSLVMADELKSLPISKSDDMAMKALSGKMYGDDEQIASRVGIFSTNYAWFDFGVYDYTKQNIASTSSQWPKDADHQTNEALHALCWLDMISPSEKQAVLAVPSTSQLKQNTSDLCKL